MTELTYRHGVPQYTLEHYERDFADRHLVHGVIEKWARETPEQVAIIEVDTGREYTYRQFDQISTALALRLFELGYRQGDFLATWLPLLAEHVFLEYACFKIGVIHAPLDLRLKPPEVIRSLGLVQAKGFAFLGRTAVADFAAAADVVRQECPYLAHCFQFSSPEQTLPGAISANQRIADAWADVPTLYAEAPDSPRWRRYREATAQVDENTGAQVIYTTGSTGYPKPALQSHRNITSQNLCLGGGFDMLGAVRQLVNLPPSHVGCQAEQLMTTFFGGGTAVILHMFDPERTLKAIQDYRVECFGQIPAMFNIQWRLPNYRDYDLSSLRFALFGGQQVSPQFVEQLRTMAPKVGTGLGMTEMAGFVTYTPLEGTLLEEHPNSVGYDMPITPLSIRKPMNPDGTAGDELPDGEVGEICFTGPQVFVGYVNNDEAYRKTVSHEGVCYTGDLGAKSPHGLLFAGRSKLVIKPKGYQIHPAQVENHFASLTERVAVCAAVGAPHDVFTEAVVLFVERRPNATLSTTELDAHAKGLAAYMRPSHYVILEPGGLPLNRIAKTDYVLLAKLATEEAAKLKALGDWDS